ncbi:hypothetical protein AADG42_18955 [Ammonicoccus fulvus]|uniref:Uncharacterized protein n=1 Tax=Ammonicoccus fulvus TaxID=3138240 RepID=A0ABZ3FXA4_9ACTN
MTNEQRPSRQLEIAGIVCVVLGILVVIFDGGAVLRVLGGILIAIGAGALVLKAREIRARQQAEGMAELRAELEGFSGVRAERTDDEPTAVPTTTGVGHHTPEPGPVDRDLAAAAGRTLATLTAHRALRELSDSETAMVAAAVSDAGVADIPTVLAAIEQTAGLAAGDPVRYPGANAQFGSRRAAAYADSWVVGITDDDAELARLNDELGLPDRFGASFVWR